jgi:hypothetical protein
VRLVSPSLHPVSPPSSHLMSPLLQTVPQMTSLEVPEEPVGRPEDAENRAGTPISSILTVVKIARWMAKAYGYRAAKKLEYTSQDKVSHETGLSGNVC